MKAYLKQHGIKLAVLVLVAALIVGLAKGGSDGEVGALSDMTNGLRAPMQRVIGSMVDWLEGIYGYIYQYDQLVEENESLRSQLAEAQQEARDAEEAARFMRDLATPGELQAFAERWRIARLLNEGEQSYRDIAAETGASTTTIARVARFLKEEPHKGYRMMIERLAELAPKKEVV